MIQVIQVVGSLLEELAAGERGITVPVMVVVAAICRIVEGSHMLDGSDIHARNEVFYLIHHSGNTQGEGYHNFTSSSAGAVGAGVSWVWQAARNPVTIRADNSKHKTFFIAIIPYFLQ